MKTVMKSSGGYHKPREGKLKHRSTCYARGSRSGYNWKVEFQAGAEVPEGEFRFSGVSCAGKRHFIIEPADLV